MRETSSKEKLVRDAARKAVGIEREAKYGGRPAHSRLRKMRDLIVDLAKALDNAD